MKTPGTRNSLTKNFTIGELASASGVSAKMIRHYESIGMIPKVTRTDSGYRVYHANDIQFLKFIKRARKLGFAMAEIKILIGLWRNKTRKSSEVKALAQKHIQSLEIKIKEMEEMALTLKILAKHCHGDSRPECPIIRSLEEESYHD